MALQVWLPLTKDLRQQGLSNVTVTNNGATFNSAGKLGGCYSFDGTDDRIYANNVSINNSAMSACCWVKFNNLTSSDYPYIFALGSNTSGTGIQIGLAVWKSDSKIHLVGNGSEPSSGYTPPTNTWIHLCITINGATTKLYVNGVLTNTQTNANSPKTQTCLCLGARPNSTSGAGTAFSYPISGYINDFRLYDHCLSPMEVKELAKGLILWYPLENNGFGQPNLLPNTSGAVREYTYPTSGTYQDKWSAQTSEIPTGSSYILSFWAKSTVNGDKIRAHYYNPNTTTTVLTSQGVSKNSASDGHIDFTLSTTWTYYWVIYGQSNTTAKKTIIFPRMGTPGNTSGVVSGTGTVSIRGVKLEEGSIPTPWCPNINDSTYTSLQIGGTTEYDCSGFCNNGTKIGTFTYTSNTPKYAVSTHIGSTSSKIHISNFPTSGFGNSYSFAWWGKRTSNSPMFWGFSDGIRLNGMYIGTLWNTGDGSNNPLYNIGTTTQVTAPSVNTWHHYVMTGNGTKCYVYLDGQLWAEAKTYKAISGTSIYINGWDSGTQYCSDNTDMSDFRVYTTALSADDVLSLYQNNAYIDTSTNPVTIYGKIRD